MRMRAPDRRLGRLLAAGAASIAIMLSAWSCAPTLGQIPVSSAEVHNEAEKQRELAFDVYDRRQERLDRVAWRVAQASAELCPRTRFAYGVTIHNIDAYENEYRKIITRKFNLTQEITVRSVIEGFPAQLAGIQAGDTIKVIQGQSLKGKTYLQSRDLMALANPATDSLRVTVTRSGSEYVFAMVGREICDYPALLVSDDVVNAYADGQRVVITTGMIRFAESDDELALVVGHEMAHNARGHLDKKLGNSLLGGILDVAIAFGTGVNTGGAFSQAAAQSFSQEFETEADYVGVYMAARAGFAIKEAPSFWRRMAVEHPGSIKTNFMASHPSTPERFLRLERAVEEIADRKNGGGPLMPENYKKGPAPTDDVYVGSGRMSKKRK